MSTIVEEIVKDGGYVILDNFIHPSQWVRPQTRINPRGGIIHWTGNIRSGASDRANRDFFDGRKGTYGSAQLIGDMDSILAALPYMPYDAELGYHVGASFYQTAHFGSYPNNCTLGYEMCVNKDGDFRESYKRAVWTMAYLGSIYSWNPLEDVMRHQDVTGKDCPLPFTDLIFSDNHCRSIGWSNEDIQWMRNNLHIDGIQGEALWIKYRNDVVEVQYIIDNGGIKMVQELIEKVKALEEEVVKLKSIEEEVIKLKALSSVNVPDFAKVAVAKALQSLKEKGKTMQENGGSYDFYRTITILDRLGLL